MLIGLKVPKAVGGSSGKGTASRDFDSHQSTLTKKLRALKSIIDGNHLTLDEVSSCLQHSFKSVFLEGCVLHNILKLCYSVLEQIEKCMKAQEKEEMQAREEWKEKWTLTERESKARTLEDFERCLHN